MVAKVGSFPASGVVVVLMAGLALAGCAKEAGEGTPATPSPTTTITSDTTRPHPKPSQSSTMAAPVGSLDELFEAVDESLGCPDPDDGFSGEAHFFFAPGRSQLEGRQCGETIVMAWSKDQSLIRSARELLIATGEPVPMVGTAEWFVADTTESREDSAATPELQARFKDLDRLATELDADVIEG